MCSLKGFLTKLSLPVTQDIWNYGPQKSVPNYQLKHTMEVLWCDSTTEWFRFLCILKRPRELVTDDLRRGKNLSTINCSLHAYNIPVIDVIFRKKKRFAKEQKPRDSHECLTSNYSMLDSSHQPLGWSMPNLSLNALHPNDRTTETAWKTSSPMQAFMIYALLLTSLSAD